MRNLAELIDAAFENKTPEEEKEFIEMIIAQRPSDDVMSVEEYKRSMFDSCNFDNIGHVEVLNNPYHANGYGEDSYNFILAA